MSGIPYTVEHSPAYGLLKLQLAANQTVLVESGAMSAMDTCMEMKSKVKGGVMKGITRMLSGESFFISEFTAKGKPGELYLSPGVPGDVQYYQLRGNSLYVQSGGFVACSPTIDLDTKFQGLKGFFSGTSLFMLKATGRGDFWFSAYGGIIEIPVTSEYVVDTGYIVAFEDSLQYDVELLGGLSFKGLKTGILGGEGFVCRFRGQGKLWIQTRNLFPLINFLQPFRPTKSD